MVSLSNTIVYQGEPFLIRFSATLSQHQLSALFDDPGHRLSRTRPEDFDCRLQEVTIRENKGDSSAFNSSPLTSPMKHCELGQRRLHRIYLT